MPTVMRASLPQISSTSGLSCVVGKVDVHQGSDDEEQDDAPDKAAGYLLDHNNAHEDSNENEYEIRKIAHLIDYIWNVLGF